MTRTTSSPNRDRTNALERYWESINHDKRPRPRNRRGPVCRHTFRGVTCTKRGAHYCGPRADRVVAFFPAMLCHIKGVHARKPFYLTGWQEHEIIRPLFGEVIWSIEHQRYVRRYRIAHIVMARKNGKSNLAAGILLLLLVGDDEEFAEVYSAAKDSKQAAMVFEPAKRMVQLSLRLHKRLRSLEHAKRIIDDKTSSYYAIMTSDAAKELGKNPHGFNLDEVLSQPNGDLWSAMETATGARAQELLFTTTTETNDDASFGADLIDEAERIQEDPARAWHVFSYVRKMPTSTNELDRLRRLFPKHPGLPVSLDVWDEANWYWPNPALGQFKSIEAMRRQAGDAKASALKENKFRQFQMNQRVQQKTRWMPLDLWDANAGDLLVNPTWWDKALAGQLCFTGMDLSSKLDMTAICHQFPTGHVLWRFWIPESVVPVLADATDGQFDQWVSDGWITATEGDAIDYESIYDQFERDAEMFQIARCVYDKWAGEPVRQALEQRTGVEFVESSTTYDRMTGPMTEAMRLLKAGEIKHGGNPVARWMAENIEAKTPRDDPDRIRPVKPDRGRSGKRIDGMPAWFFALDAQMLTKEVRRSAYEDDDFAVI